MSVQQQGQQTQQSGQAGFNPFVVDPTGMPPIDFSQYVVPEIPIPSGQQQTQQPGQKPSQQGLQQSSQQFSPNFPDQQSAETQTPSPFSFDISFDTPGTQTPSEPQVDFSFDLTEVSKPLDTQQQVFDNNQIISQKVDMSQMENSQTNIQTSSGTSEDTSSQSEFFSTPNQPDPNFGLETSSFSGEDIFQLQNDGNTGTTDTLHYGFPQDDGEQEGDEAIQQNNIGEKSTNQEIEAPVFSSPSPSTSVENLGINQTLPEVYFDLKLLVEELMEMLGETSNYTATGQREPTNLEYIFTPTTEPVGLVITRDETFPDTGENTIHTLQFIEKEDVLSVLFQDVHLLDVAIDEDDETEAGNLVKKKLLLLTKLLTCDREVLVKQHDEALKKQAIIAELAKF